MRDGSGFHSTKMTLLFHRDGEKNMEARIAEVVKVEKVPAINTQKFFFMLLTKYFITMSSIKLLLVE